MIFTKEDITRIKKNIKTIRLAYGCKTQLDFALALDPDARYPGLSYDMIKKYESDGYPITEEAVRLIASLTLFSFEDIVFENLDDYLEPDSLVFDNDEIEEINKDKDLLKEIGHDLSVIFPLFTSDESLKDPLFARAYQISVTKLDKANFNEEDLLEAINTFGQTNYPETFLNYLSLVGRLYVNYIYWGMKQETLKKINAKKHESVIDYAVDLHKHRKVYKEHALFMAEVKRKFLNIYNLNLTKCMKEAAKEAKYKDYVYYYLGIRYYFGIMDNDITKMSDVEMNSFGINMLECLEIIGNKYAIEFKKIMKDWVHHTCTRFFLSSCHNLGVKEEKTMTNLKKINDILTLVVSAATAVVKLSEIWKEVGPDVKKALEPVIEGCKKIASASTTVPAEIETK